MIQIEVITTIMDTQYTVILFKVINDMSSQGPVYNFPSVFTQAWLCQVKTQTDSNTTRVNDKVTLVKQKLNKSTYSMNDLCWVDILERDGGEHFR